MQRHITNLAWFFVGVVISVALLFPVQAHAADPVAITWSDGPPGTTPTSVCSSYFSAINVYITYGYPTYYTCRNAAGAHVSHSYMTPSCPVGYLVDFNKLMCLPSSSVLESLLAMTVSDAVQLAWAIILLWLIAWGIRQAIRALNSGENHVEES